jgi:hypothetical protein
MVQIVDKTYLKNSFVTGNYDNYFISNISKYNLNEEQERAIRIIANHAISLNSEKLKMYLGGIGGTGKSQVIKALSNFFIELHQSHRFIIVAPTGSAAAILGGSTYHYMFGINEFQGSNLSQIRSRLIGVNYVFIDEVSMLSAQDLYKISHQLSCVFNVFDIPFGGLNMVFAGDFAQLPPVIGGEHTSLYSRTIGTFSTNAKSQEEAIGKALWHQVTTVVILRKNMRQIEQNVEDMKLRTALENMRYKSRTSEDIEFLQSRISSKSPNCASIADDDFHNVSIITAFNVHKDEINCLGAIRFACETGQKLTEFFSDDNTKIRTDSKNQSTFKSKILKIENISREVQEILWNQPPSTTSMHIAGKLSLCIGMPIMIRNNFATELCLTKGQEGYVHGWQTKIGSQKQQMLDTLFYY